MLDDVEKDLQAVTAELIEVQDQLLAMYNLASALRGYLEPVALLTALVEEAVRLVHAADGFAAMDEDDGRIVTSPGFDLDPAECWRLIGMARKGTDVMVSSIPSVGRVMLVSIPLHDRPSAVLALVRESGASFTAPEQKLMAAIGAYGGAQLEGVLLHQETLRRARVELEFELARSIQADLSPAVPTGHPGVDVYAVSRPAHDVGGAEQAHGLYHERLQQRVGFQVAAQVAGQAVHRKQLVLDLDQLGGDRLEVLLDVAQHHLTPSPLAGEGRGGGKDPTFIPGSSRGASAPGPSPRWSAPAWWRSRRRRCRRRRGRGRPPRWR